MQRGNKGPRPRHAFGTGRPADAGALSAMGNWCTRRAENTKIEQQLCVIFQRVRRKGFPRVDLQVA